MKKYIKIYLEAINYDYTIFIPCEICSNPAVDIHHIKYKSRGGQDEIKNLMALCRSCHAKAHNEALKESELKQIHDEYIRRH